jgi:beta-glucanase (GH16 family)
MKCWEPFITGMTDIALPANITHWIQEPFKDEYHEFSAIWTEDCIQFLIDGEKYGNPVSRSTTLPTTWPFDQPFHMILNIAVGGNLPGNPDASTTFPQVMEVDYVRVYQLK